LIIEIDGDPEPQSRMKFTQIGGFGRAYDPKAKQKDQIRNVLRSKADLHDYKFPRISFLFMMPIPSGTSKKKLLEMQSERVKHIKRPDVDNLVKLYLDCMDGIVFERDEHVSLGLCVKVYSSKPRTVICIRESPPHLLDSDLQEFSSESGRSDPALSVFQVESYGLPPLVLSQCGHMTRPDCRDQPLSE
jgi:Holliday junction resolvase RusA-like endonuclease